LLQVHGIGESQWSKHQDYSFVQRINKLRRKVEKLQADQQVRKTSSGFYVEGGGRIEFLPVEWHDVVHEAKVAQQLKAVTLNNQASLRQFTNSVLMDIMYYCSPTVGPTISKVAARLLLFWPEPSESLFA
jgi:hypothetical protein